MHLIREYIVGYTNYYDLLRDYQSSLGRSRSSSILGFCRFVEKKDKKENIVKIFIEVFGLAECQALMEKMRTESLQLQSRLDERWWGDLSVSSKYTNRLNGVVRNFILTLRFHLEDVRQRRLAPASMPVEANYSWLSDRMIDSETQMGKIRLNIVKFLKIYPYPNQLAKVLGLTDIEYFRRILAADQVRLNEAVNCVFSLLRVTAPAFDLSLQTQETLLKHGAMITPASLSTLSWVHEIEQWAGGWGGEAQIIRPHNYFKLAHLIGRFATPTLSVSSSGSSSTSSSSTSFHSSASLATVVRTHRFRSFRTYLLNKTLDLLLSRGVDSMQVVRQVFFNLLEENESIRLDFLFFWQVLHSLFFQPANEPAPSLKSMLDILLPLDEQANEEMKGLNAYARVIVVRDRIFTGASDQVKMFANLILFLFMIEHFVVTGERLVSDKAALTIWMYEWLSMPHRAATDFWAIALRGKIPPKCLEELLKANQELYSNEVFLCLYDWLCLLSNDPQLGMIEACLRDLRFHLRFSEAAHQELSERRRSLLSLHDIEEGHPHYNLMNSLLYLFHFQDRLHLEFEAQELLFEQLLKISPEDQVRYFEEIIPFATHLDYYIEEGMSDKDKVRLVIWIYERKTIPDRRTDDFWENILTGKIPRQCLEELLVANWGSRYDPRTFLCVYDWLCLSEKNVQLHFVATTFQQIGFELRFHEVNRDDESAAAPISKREKRKRLLSMHGIDERHPTHPLMNAIIDLLSFQDYMKLTRSAQEFYFERIISTAAEDRANCFEEAERFMQALKPVNEDPLVCRTSMLQRACERRGERASHLAPYLENLQSSHSVDYQITIITRLERLIETPVPLVTILILSLYCPYLPLKDEDAALFDDPLFIQQLDGLIDWKKSPELARKNSLFVDPIELNKIETILPLFSDPQIPAACYQNGGHPTCLDLHFSAILQAVQQVLVPSFFFKHTLLELALPLFTSEGKVVFHPHQNLVCSTSGVQDHNFYFGEWRTMLYMANWNLQKGIPTFEIVLWRSLHDLNSQSIQVQLMLSPGDLSKDLFDLLETMLESFGQELCIEEYADQINSLANEEEELQFCLSLKAYGYFKSKWDEFILNRENGERIAVALFNFVRTLKVEMRKHQVLLHASPALRESRIFVPVSEGVLVSCSSSSSSSSGPSHPQTTWSDSDSDSDAHFNPDVCIEPTDDLINPPLLTALREICEECRSLSKPKQFEMGEHAEGWKLTLTFNPCRPTLATGMSSSSSSSVDEETEEVNLNEWTASRIRGEIRFDYSFKLGDLLKHPRAPFLLNWLIDAAYQKAIECGGG